jgi:hypothetical protein
MADKKISQLTASTTPLAGTEVLPVVQSGATKKATVENILTSVQPGGTANGVVFLNASKVATTNANFTYNGSSLVVKTGSSFVDNFVLESTEDGSTAAPDFVLYRNSPSPAASDNIGNIIFRGKDSGGNDDTYGFILTQINSPTSGAEASTLIFRSRQAADGLVDRLSVASNVTVHTGNLVIGTAGKGIDFSATTEGSGTMTSELFSDYEEGTFTCGMAASTSGTITLNASYRTGRYTKIGRQVTVCGFLVVSSVASPVGALTITGLPFTNGANDSNLVAGAVYANGLDSSATTSLIARLGPSATALEVAVFAAGSSAQAAEKVLADAQFTFMATYFVS